ncbi:hypothetical protein [Rubripirellula lacrimiformis]|uniref:hypothetical protein n=1 Tax=Rubripirellula lacrimiformis TaxID=1930273 RepID=UPI0011A2D3DB|nr:hypothetical protein [Rubripirellula lacrimiformis]
MKRIVLFLLVAVFVLGFAFPIATSARRGYHRFRLRSAQEEILNGNLDGTLLNLFGNGLEAQSHHLARLAAIGDISHATYVLPQVPNDSGERRKLCCELARNNCPASLYFSSEETFDSQPMTLDVWCELEDLNAWLVFLKTCDDRVLESGSPGTPPAHPASDG